MEVIAPIANAKRATIPDNIAVSQILNQKENHCLVRKICQSIQWVNNNQNVAIPNCLLNFIRYRDILYMQSLRNGKTYFGIELLFISFELSFIVFDSFFSVEIKYSIDIFSVFIYFFHKKVIGLINKTIVNSFRHRLPRNSCWENPILLFVVVAEISVITTIVGRI